MKNILPPPTSLTELTQSLPCISDLTYDILFPCSIADKDEDGIDQSDMVLKGGESHRDEFVYNIDLERPFSFGQTAIRYGWSMDEYNTIGATQGMVMSYMYCWY